MACSGNGESEIFVDCVFVSNQITPENIDDFDLDLGGPAPEPASSQAEPITSVEQSTMSQAEPITSVEQSTMSQAEPITSAEQPTTSQAKPLPSTSEDLTSVTASSVPT
ncbi:hypothetical protein ACHAPU_007167 [Fusarium lateritium]